MRYGLTTAAIAVFAVTLARAQAPSEPPDPYLWLEDVASDRATAWVKAENEKTLAALESDPRYAGLYVDDLKIVEAKDRIPTPAFLDRQIYNVWQDADHVRGVWRKTSLRSYRSSRPAWTTVLDIDALAKAEGSNWFLKGEDCREPDERRCLISLSDGGEDAVTVREFDLRTRSFVPGGFVLPSGKQSAAWESPDTVLAARQWVKGEVTASGYPYVVKRLVRGRPLTEAVDVFRGAPTDVGVSPRALQDGSGHEAVLIQRSVTFFQSETYLVTPAGVLKLALPLKCDIETLVAGRLIVSLKEPWAAGAARFAAGDVVSLSLDAVRRDPAHLKPALVYAPGPRQSFSAAAATKDHLILTAFDNVRGRALVLTPTAGGGWSKVRLALPENASIDVVDADGHGDRAFLNVTSFLAPSSVSLLNADTRALQRVKTSPPRFDASKDAVEQFEAESSDGTKIPYFIVHPRTMARDGANPTILYAYGGFQVSMTPVYSAAVGKLWLEKGGVYVLANIRGGGEFGPAWHDAGLKTHRQIIYDDFAAVAEDLISRRITSPRRLGIEGGSNGGLLMGVEFTQRPDLWRAVDIQVPLLDMLRYEQIAAGSSWVGEYGSVSNPDERAFLAKISPYANLKPGVDYPEPFIWTTTKDDRVGPQHARKFAAKLQGMGRPYLFYEVTEGGHASGANLKERARTTALEMTYFTRKLMD
jgi:prolyl oligopeptidase